MKTGTSMGRIENTRRVNSIKCDCSKCFHSSRIRGFGISIRVCNYYNIDNPNKSKCARFSLKIGATLTKKKSGRKHTSKRKTTKKS